MRSKPVCALLKTVGILAMASTASAFATEVPADLKTLQKFVQRHQDYIEIQNLMSLRSHYHAVSDKMGEFALWARRPDIVWGTAVGYRIGYEHVRLQYTNGVKQQQDRLEAMIMEKGDRSIYALINKSVPFL